MRPDLREKLKERAMVDPLIHHALTSRQYSPMMTDEEMLVELVLALSEDAKASLDILINERERAPNKLFLRNPKEGENF